MSSCTAQNNQTKGDNDAATTSVDIIQTGAERTSEYLPLLEGKKVALLINQTSVVPDAEGHWVSLVDTLLASEVDVRFVMAPEHGVEGLVSAGDAVGDQKLQNKKKDLQVYSLYGKNKKPQREWLDQIDCVVFDVQDVGCRFYTYLSTLYYLLQACGECDKEVFVLDRPNPNDTIDGPLLEDAFQSFVGMVRVPLLHGCTLGELAQMMTQERWIGDQLPQLQVITASHWKHGDDYSLPIAPSPNLRSDHAIRLYPSLCLFEATDISIGRGTDFPFEMIGHPEMTGDFTFVPHHCQAASHPLQEDKECHGCDLREVNVGKGFHLQWLLACHQHFSAGDKAPYWVKQPKFFDRLAGTDKLRKQIDEGVNETFIRASWQKDLSDYRKLREKYILYHER